MADPFNVSDLIDFPATDQCKGTACPAGTSGSTNTVYIIFNIFRYVIVKYDVHTTDIYPSGRYISSDQEITASIPERIHNRIPLILGKISVKSLCLISSFLQEFCHLINHLFGITKDQSPYRLIVIKQSADRLLFILSCNFVIGLFYC